MKKLLSVILSIIMIFSAFAVPASAYASSVGQVKSVKVISTTSSSVKLKWKKVKGATGYKIYYSTKKSKGYKKGKTIKKGSTVSGTVKSLKSNKKYYFKVRAVKKKKNGKFSKVVSAKTKAAKATSSEVEKVLLNNYVYWLWTTDRGMSEYKFYKTENGIAYDETIYMFSGNLTTDYDTGYCTISGDRVIFDNEKKITYDKAKAMFKGEKEESPKNPGYYRYSYYPVFKNKISKDKLSDFYDDNLLKYTIPA